MFAFKENKDEQFYRDESGDWIKCDEEKIDALWLIWVRNEQGTSIKYVDKDGFTVFDYK